MRYQHIVREFYQRTRHKDMITSDDFRDQKFDDLLKGDKQFSIGGFFSSMIKEKFVIETGRWIRSGYPQNHGRKIRLYLWSSLAKMRFSE